MSSPYIPLPPTPEQLAQLNKDHERSLLFKPVVINEKEEVRKVLRACEKEARKMVEADMKKQYGAEWHQHNDGYAQKVSSITRSLAFRRGYGLLIKKYNF